MKKTTCKELKGACDAEITGETAEEMGKNSQKHVMEMVQAGDEAHKAAMDEMMKMGPEAQGAWYQGFVDSFDTLPEA